MNRRACMFLIRKTPKRWPSGFFRFVELLQQGLPLGGVDLRPFIKFGDRERLIKSWVFSRREIRCKAQSLLVPKGLSKGRREQTRA